MKRIVALGGGHGLSMLMKALSGLDIERTAIVSVADDGGSSGRLRHDLDVVAPGDIRSCMLAMTSAEASRDARTFAQMFGYRFDAGELDGHSLGNLILVALAREYGSFEKAVAQAGRLLEIDGKVFPATESSVVLCARTSHGLIRGQVQIEQCANIEKVFLDPGDAKPLEGVVESIGKADHIIYAPGSLFTSVIPSFVIPEIAHAIKISSADVTMILNLNNRGPDTSGMSGDQHLAKVLSHGGRVNKVICDASSLIVEHPPDGIGVTVSNIKAQVDEHDPKLLRDCLRKELDLPTS